MQNFKLFLLFSLYLLLFGCSQPNKKISTRSNYELVENWIQLPADFTLGTPAGLGINTEGDLFVFHRGSRVWNSFPPSDSTMISESTILKIDGKSGELLESWGENLFIMPHGLEVDQEDNVWVTDCGLQQVFKFDKSGNLILTLGEPRVIGDDSLHFGLPTDVAVASDGSFYISDGYVNSRIVKFTSEGEYLFEWGSKGMENGEFNIPHGIDLDENGNVYVADRENNRIQIFDANGQFLNEWQNKKTDQLYSVIVDKSRSHLFGIDYFIQDDTIKGSDIFRFDLETNVQVQFGRSGNYTGPITRYHDIAVDAEGSLYLGDILGNRIQKFELTSD